MARGRKKELYYDKTNKVYFQYLIKNGKRVKCYLASVRGKTNDPEGKARAIAKWMEIQEREGLTPYGLRKKRDTNKARLAKGTDHRGLRNPQTVIGIMDHYLWFHLRRFKDGQISQSRYINIRSGIRYFEKWLNRKVYDLPSDKSGGPRGILTIPRIEYYHQHLTDKVHAEKMARNYAIGLLKAVKEFYKWAYHHERRFVAREVPPKWLKIAKPQVDDLSPAFQYDNIKIFEQKDIFTALKSKSKHPVGLWTLIALNIGATSSDLASLKRGHIETDHNGMPIRIKKMRVKSRQPGQWRLFNSTAIALKAYIDKYQIHNPNELLFLDRRGRPVVREILKDGKPSHKYDAIIRAFSRLDLERGLSFRHLRKTTATMLGRNTAGKHPLLYQAFLAHRPTQISIQYYVGLDPTLLDNELMKIEEQLELFKLLPLILKHIDEVSVSRYNYHNSGE